mmetsp:Transcript_12143/g.38887  ORF Transcript_12143/g.38887 Transcript_12143/m.38887 type:complete len:243 (+) Transcript_12143:142-870(+)
MPRCIHAAGSAAAARPGRRWRRWKTKLTNTGRRPVLRFQVAASSARLTTRSTARPRRLPQPPASPSRPTGTRAAPCHSLRIGSRLLCPLRSCARTRSSLPATRGRCATRRSTSTGTWRPTGRGTRAARRRGSTLRRRGATGLGSWALQRRRWRWRCRWRRTARWRRRWCCLRRSLSLRRRRSTLHSSLLPRVPPTRLRPRRCQTRFCSPDTRLCESLVSDAAETPGEVSPAREIDYSGINTH